MSTQMDLNTLPFPEDNEEYVEQHPVKRFTQHDHETSVHLLRREREERRQRMRDQTNDRPMRAILPEPDEGPQSKKPKYDRNKLPQGVLLFDGAIHKFAEVRPPGIYKHDYIDKLYAFYHETKSNFVVSPPTPEWKRSSDFDLNGEALPEDDDGVPYDSISEKQESIVMMTNDDVLGDEIPDEQEIQLRKFCLKMLRLPPPTKGHAHFPGSHPVSLDRENLQLLRQHYYYATWKADGTRYMLLISSGGCFLSHQFTLLDGEMIIDTISPEKQERRYLLYDLIAINGVSIVARPFSERWKLIKKEVVDPRRAERESIDKHPDKFYRYDLEPFRVRRKDFWLLSAVQKVLKEFIPTLSHQADGLIFQVGEDGAEFLYLYDRGKKRLMDNNRVTFGDGFDPPASYSGKIIECAWDSEENVWVCMRLRVDKSTPNEFNTYRKVMRSITDNITEDVLLNEINEIIRLPMYVEHMQPPPPPSRT